MTDIVAEALRVADESWGHKETEKARHLLRSLAAIVGRLPVTADGVRVTQGMEVFYLWRPVSTYPMEVVNKFAGPLLVGESTTYYSTREAALAARGGGA